MRLCQEIICKSINIFGGKLKLQSFKYLQDNIKPCANLYVTKNCRYFLTLKPAFNEGFGMKIKILQSNHSLKIVLILK